VGFIKGHKVERRAEAEAKNSMQKIPKISWNEGQLQGIVGKETKMQISQGSKQWA
jgi:hypothetical protein